MYIIKNEKEFIIFIGHSPNCIFNKPKTNV